MTPGRVFRAPMAETRDMAGLAPESQDRQSEELEQCDDGGSLIGFGNKIEPMSRVDTSVIHIESCTAPISEHLLPEASTESENNRGISVESQWIVQSEGIVHKLTQSQKVLL